MTNEAAVSPALPKINDYGLVKVHPQAILDRKIMRKGDRSATMVLVQWSNLLKEDATREELDDQSVLQFPDFNTNY
jgi:hypothetical protein